MAQKVISVNVLVNKYDKESGIYEHDFPELTKALADGCSVKEVVSTKVDGLNVINLTFILEKPEKPRSAGITRVN